MKRTITERMVINSTNINNTSNHLSNKLLNKKKRATYYGDGNPSPDLGQA